MRGIFPEQRKKRNPNKALSYQQELHQEEIKAFKMKIVLIIIVKKLNHQQKKLVLKLKEIKIKEEEILIFNLKLVHQEVQHNQIF